MLKPLKHNEQRAWFLWKGLIHQHFVPFITAETIIHFIHRLISKKNYLDLQTRSSWSLITLVVKLVWRHCPVRLCSSDLVELQCEQNKTQQAQHYWHKLYENILKYTHSSFKHLSSGFCLNFTLSPQTENVFTTSSCWSKSNGKSSVPSKLFLLFIFSPIILMLLNVSLSWRRQNWTVITLFSPVSAAAGLRLTGSLLQKSQS